MAETLSAWERYTASLWSGPIALAISRIRDGRFLAANQDFLSLLGYERRELVDHTTFELGLWPDLDRRNTIAATLEKKETIRDVPVAICAKGSRLITVMASFRRLFHEDEPCVIGVAADVSDWVEYEKDLEEEVVELASENLRQTRFSIGLKTKLQSPLDTNSVYLSKAMSECRMDEASRHLTSLALENVERMRRYLAEAAVPEPAGKRGEKVTVDATEILTEVINEISRAGQPCRITVDVRPPMTVRGDLRALKRLFCYVLESMLESSQNEDDQLWIQASRSGENWLFSCQFVSESPGAVQTLDLSPQLRLAGRIVERQGGKLWVVSELKRQPGIWFTLPVASGA